MGICGSILHGDSDERCSAPPGLFYLPETGTKGEPGGRTALPDLGSGREMLAWSCPSLSPTLRGPPRAALIFRARGGSAQGLCAATDLAGWSRPIHLLCAGRQVPRSAGGCHAGSPVINRRGKSLGPKWGGRSQQAAPYPGNHITPWKNSPARRKFQGNGDFAPLPFFLSLFLWPSTDVNFHLFSVL